MDQENPSDFVRARLPWIIGAAFLVLFLVTLNQWVNLHSLPAVTRAAGWDWSTPVQAPLFYIVTLPVRLFPAAIQPLVLNVFTAICGALTLALLARCVALLPHDRTHEQRLRERSDYSLLSTGLAWVPVVLAVLVCALELTFWEHATAITGEMFDLLIFAYLVRCLLEYRITLEERWLSKMALLYGLGITNNWALIGYFPLFLAALIWIRGVRFFEPAFLVQMTLLGFLGLLLYLFLPILWEVKHEGDYTLWQLLRANWTSQKTFLVNIPPLRNRVLLLGLPSVLPVILMGIRWPSRSGETSAAGANLTTVAFRVIHLFILAACLFVAFDTKYSPRQLGLGIPFLTFYFLGALAIGYYSGYALLVFSDPPRKSWRRENVALKIINPIVRTAVLLAMVAVPAALASRNIASIHASNGKLLKEFVARTVQTLPPAPAYLLSEDAYQIGLLQGYLAGEGKAKDYVLVNTRILESPDYHESLRKYWGERWPSLGSREELGSRIAMSDIQGLALGLVKSNSVAYLHPSFGYFFEVLYLEPNGAVYPLRLFTADQVLPPALRPEQISANQNFWTGMQETIAKIKQEKALDSVDANYIGQFYSRGLNTWGVFAQRNGKFAEAGKLFESAYDLNTNNVPARFNAQFNQAYQTGKPENFDLNKNLEEKFGKYRSWDSMLDENGPFDQPDLCALLGDGFLTQNQYRQAALQFSRAAFFQPTNFAVRVNLAKAYVYGNWVDKGMAEIAKLKSDFKEATTREQAEIISVEAAAYFTENDFAKAEKTLQDARAHSPEQGALTQSLFELYRVAGKYTNALAIANEQLQSNPTNVMVLLQKAELLLNLDPPDLNGAHATADEVLKLVPRNTAALLFEAFVSIKEAHYDHASATIDKVLQLEPDNQQAKLYQGIILMEQKQGDKAREVFTQVLDKQPDNLAALRNRAILNLRAQRWSEAKDDYVQLRKIKPKDYSVMYGLAEVAYAQKDFVAATHYYELYLKYAPANAQGELQDERKRVEQRLGELKTINK